MELTPLSAKKTLASLGLLVYNRAMERVSDESAASADIFAEAPFELTHSKLNRLAEGIGKVVYASDHWVVKRDRSPSEILGLVVVWRLLRKCQRLLPASLCERMLEKPSRQIRILKILAQASMAIVPKAIWFSTHIRQVWKQYLVRSRRGDRLAQRYLDGTSFVPERIEFPPTRVRIGGWPGWLTVSEATERVDTTLFDELTSLARQDRFDEIESWLDRLLQLRQRAWRKGLFSADAHLKNFGIIGQRVVLLDTGGLTNRWPEVETELEREEAVDYPHERLGLGSLLSARPDIAARFNQRWKDTVNRQAVRELWPHQAA